MNFNETLSPLTAAINEIQENDGVKISIRNKAKSLLKFGRTIEVNFDPYFIIKPNSDVVLSTTSSVGSTEVNGSFNCYLALIED